MPTDFQLNAVIRMLTDKLEAAEAERDALRLQLDEACEALEPIADLWPHYERYAEHSEDWLLPLSDFRRARAVYEKIKGGTDA